MDIEEDIREHVLNTLPYAPELRSELEAKRASDLLIIYLNWCNRLVPAQPRTAHRSVALNRNPLVETLRSDLEKLIEKIENGHDLTAHLSKRVKVGYESPTVGSHGRRQDLDLMLGDWQVHHLHLSSEIETDGFVKRDGPLLFVAFRAKDAYLIDIFPHRAWTREEIANILIDEWPNSGFVHEAKGIIEISHIPTEEERSMLRGAGINAPFIERNGKFYMIGRGGLTSAGTPVVATRQAQFLLKAARAFEHHVAANPKHVIDMLRANGFESPSSPDLHLYLAPNGAFGIIERHTRAIFSLGSS